MKNLFFLAGFGLMAFMTGSQAWATCSKVTPNGYPYSFRGMESRAAAEANLMTFARANANAACCRTTERRACCTTPNTELCAEVKDFSLSVINNYGPQGFGADLKFSCNVCTPETRQRFNADLENPPANSAHRPPSLNQLSNPNVQTLPKIAPSKLKTTPNPAECKAAPKGSKESAMCK